MSYVTNTVLAFSISEDIQSRLRDVNAFFEARERTGFLNTWDASAGCAGGSKRMEHPTFLAAFNYLELPLFVSWLQAVKWEEPELVQLFVREQDAEKYRMVTL